MMGVKGKPPPPVVLGCPCVSGRLQGCHACAWRQRRRRPKEPARSWRMGRPAIPVRPVRLATTLCGWLDSRRRVRTAAAHPGDSPAQDRAISSCPFSGPPGSLEDQPRAGPRPPGRADAAVCNTWRPPRRQPLPVVRELPASAGRTSRRRLPILPGLEMRLNVRARHPTSDLPGTATRRWSDGSPVSSPGVPAISRASLRVDRSPPCGGAWPGSCVRPLRWGILRRDANCLRLPPSP